MNDETFDEFLKEFHAQIYIGTDDAMPDAFEKWLEDNQIDEIIKLADIFAKDKYLQGYKKAADLAITELKKI